MRYSRIVAAVVFTSALILALALPSQAAAVTDTLYCDSAVGYYQPLNSTAGKWEDFTPSVGTSGDRFTFSGIPNVLVSGNYEYSFDHIAFLMYPNNEELSFQDGYVYTYNFTIRSTMVSTPDLTSFQFGVCLEGYSDALPLADVVYTYDLQGSSTVYYYVTATVNVDDTFPQTTLPNPNDAYLYLRMGSEWTNTFSLVASELTMRKAVGEGAYYQASLDAIENLPNTEYDFILNKMPDAEGQVEAIKGEVDDITRELNVYITDVLGVLAGIEANEPLVYFPEITIPILDININSMIQDYVGSDGYFRPLSMINDIAPSAIGYINVGRYFLQVVLAVSFITIGLDKMLKIEWWL